MPGTVLALGRQGGMNKPDSLPPVVLISPTLLHMQLGAKSLMSKFFFHMPLICSFYLIITELSLFRSSYLSTCFCLITCALVFSILVHPTCYPRLIFLNMYVIPFSKMFTGSFYCLQKKLQTPQNDPGEI